MPSMRPRVFAKNEEVAVSPLDIPTASPAETYQPPPPSEDFRDEMPLLGTFESDVIVEKSTPVTIQLSQDLYNEYNRVAMAQELTVEEVIQHRLEACKSHNAIRGLWFSDSERTQLENLLQKWPLETGSQALGLIARAATVRFDDIQITLTPAQKKVVVARAAAGKSPKSLFESIIQKEFRV